MGRYGRTRFTYRDDKKVCHVHVEDINGVEIWNLNTAESLNPEDDSGQWQLTGEDLEGCEWHDSRKSAWQAATEMGRRYHTNHGL